jgi:hypothetical protein
MNTKLNARTAVACVALVVSLALTGCAVSTAASTTSQTPTATSASAPPVNTAALQVGDVVDAATAKILNKPYLGSPKAYKLASGKYVIVNKDLPLPPAVQAEVQAKVDAIPRATDITTHDGAQASLDALNAAGDVEGDVQSTTSKYVIVVMETATSLDNGTNLVAWVGTYVYAPGITMTVPSSTSAEAVAKMQAQIDVQADPGQYLIVVRQ